MTQEERRIKILEKRLRLLALYLETFDGSGNAPSFADFAKSKGVTYEMFIKDLPPEYQGVPANGYDRILEYAIRLQELHAGQYRIAEMEEIAADGNNLERGYIRYQPGQYIREDCGCGCNGNCGGGDVTGAMGDDKSSSADGGDSEPYMQYIFQEGTEPGLNFAASGGCGLPPVPPPFPNPKKVKNSIQKAARKAWDKYKEKHAAYRRCVNAKKQSSGYTLDEKSQHVLQLSNPMSAIGRKAFLDLVSFNIFGLASSFEAMKSYPNQSYWDRVRHFWYRFGGDPNKLSNATEKGKNKKAVFKPKGWKPKNLNSDGGAGEIAGAIVAATAVISAIVPIIKEFKKDKGEPDALTYDPLTPDARIAEELPDTSGTGVLDNINWAIAAPIGIALVIGIGFAIYKATK